MEAKYKREKEFQERERGEARVVMWGRNSLLAKIRR